MQLINHMQPKNIKLISKFSFLFCIIWKKFHKEIFLETFPRTTNICLIIFHSQKLILLTFIPLKLPHCYRTVTTLLPYHYHTVTIPLPHRYHTLTSGKLSSLLYNATKHNIQQLYHPRTTPFSHQYNTRTVPTVLHRYRNNITLEQWNEIIYSNFFSLVKLKWLIRQRCSFREKLEGRHLVAVRFGFGKYEAGPSSGRRSCDWLHFQSADCKRVSDTLKWTLNSWANFDPDWPWG